MLKGVVQTEFYRNREIKSIDQFCRSPNLLPILQPEYAVEQIMEAILTNRETLIMPKFCYFVVFLAR